MRDFFFKFSFVLLLRVKFINAEIEGREKIISIIKIIYFFLSKILNLGTRPIRLELGRVHQFSQPSILLVMKSWSWGWYWCNMFCADPKVWLQGESHLHVQCSVKSKTIVHVSWGIKYPQAFIDQGKKTVSKKLYRGPLQLLGRKYWLDEIGPDVVLMSSHPAGGCLKYWRVGDPMLLGPVSTPHLTLNVSSSDHCQRSISHIICLENISTNFHLRLIFELPPTVLDGIVTATNIAGVKRRIFRNLTLLCKVVPWDVFIFQDSLVVKGQNRGTFVQPNYSWPEHRQSKHWGNQKTQGCPGEEREEESEGERQGVGIRHWDDHSYWSDSVHHTQHLLQVWPSEGFNSYVVWTSFDLQTNQHGGQYVRTRQLTM